MGVRLERCIEYWTESVVCFDPEKLVAKLLDAFPAATFDPTDYSEEELRRFEQYAQDRIESDEQRATMLRQMTTKTRRIGPVYRFCMGDSDEAVLQGHVARYRVVFESANPVDLDLRKEIVQFLESLDLGTVNINDDYEKQ